LASSPQQMNSLRAKGVMSFQDAVPPLVLPGGTCFRGVNRHPDDEPGGPGLRGMQVAAA
jgi:hypothetical protein